MPYNGPVAGHAAGKNNRIRRHASAEKRIHDIFGQSQTQPIADLLQAVAFLLRMHEVGFGKHRAARGDFRNRSRVFHCDLAQFGGVF